MTRGPCRLHSTHLCGGRRGLPQRPQHHFRDGAAVGVAEPLLCEVRRGAALVVHQRGVAPELEQGPHHLCRVWVRRRIGRELGRAARVPLESICSMALSLSLSLSLGISNLDSKHTARGGTGRSPCVTPCTVSYSHQQASCPERPQRAAPTSRWRSAVAAPTRVRPPGPCRGRWRRSRRLRPRARSAPRSATV